MMVFAGNTGTTSAVMLPVEQGNAMPQPPAGFTSSLLPDRSRLC